MELSVFSRNTLKLGFGVAAICLLLAAGAWLYAPFCANPHNAFLLQRGFREAGPALAATAVCAALICDVVLKKDLHR